MGPSESIVAAAAETRTVVDSLGRRIAVRCLTALDKLRVLKAAGPDLSLNQPWLTIAVLASSVTAIDDLPIPSPTNEPQIEALVGRLGDAGLDAVADALEPLLNTTDKERTAAAGNLPGTPS